MTQTHDTASGNRYAAFISYRHLPPDRAWAAWEFLRRMNVLPWDCLIAQRYATVRAEMERQSKVLAPLDLLIAAHALDAAKVLVTNDQAFAQVAGLHREDWTA